ncbi:vitelline membrane protein 15a-3-like [Aedes aegypti]|uniref:Uncharacterized protein n=1 Tax=Aedes aegypti TaxID=7159 RepID=A0A6I8U4J2_AEDAE|nr:vitelline membrane protein 15a-3-like [Aedes aegypti]
MLPFAIISLFVVTYLAGAMANPPYEPNFHGYPGAMNHPHPMEEAPPVSPTCGSNLLIGCGDPQATQVPCSPSDHGPKQHDRPAYHYGRPHSIGYRRPMDSEMDEADFGEDSFEDYRD